ncbi:DUF3039 domain-containing protein [Arcanobacterium hippocoleae]|uniref:DUF3039 domain-containing protein n=1 Tax=Arcanobacterium hippocoleae TaxID=149017 RepID=A0ABU1SZM3_9ACTO|nr:hypothetical protein [Arcanobacterium hippocoleae]
MKNRKWEEMRNPERQTIAERALISAANHLIRPRSSGLDAPSDPGQIGGAAEPETAGKSSTALLERTEEEKAPGDNERFAHYVREDRIMKSMVEGGPVVALCGKVWVPVRNPDNYPLCPTCKEIYQHLRGGNDGGKWPFGPEKP